MNKIFLFLFMFAWSPTGSRFLGRIVERWSLKLRCRQRTFIKADWNREASWSTSTLFAAVERWNLVSAYMKAQGDGILARFDFCRYVSCVFSYFPRTAAAQVLKSLEWKIIFVRFQWINCKCYALFVIWTAWYIKAYLLVTLAVEISK